MSDHQVVGKIGRVTGAIRPGAVGEAIIPVRGPAKHFNALDAAKPSRPAPASSSSNIFPHHHRRTDI